MFSIKIRVITMKSNSGGGETKVSFRGGAQKPLPRPKLMSGLALKVTEKKKNCNS